MTVAMVLLVVALGAGWLGPIPLRRLDPLRHEPLLLIVAWLGTMATAVVTAETAIALLLLNGHRSGAPLPTLVGHSSSALRHGSVPRVEDLAGLAGVMLLAAVSTRVVIVSVRGARRRARKRQDDLALLLLAGRPATGPADVLWLPHERPLAFCMPGHPGVVVATDGLTRHLSDAALAAVLTHERAHLTGHHHHLIAVTDGLRAALPFVPLFRHAARAIHPLVELAADAAAVRACGPAAVRTALLTVTGHDAPPGSLAIARDDVDLRLDRLRHGHEDGAELPVLRALATGTAAALPILVGCGLLLGLLYVALP